MKRVAVFGIFDGVHNGHRDLFRQAKELGEELVVIVGRDETAEKLKGKRPKYSEAERAEMLKKEPLVDQVFLGDKESSTYTVLVQCSPDIVCLGYDQDELKADLQKWMAKTGKNFQIHRANPYKDGALHNSLLH